VVTTIGKIAIAKLTGNQQPDDPITQIGLGTGTAAAQASDTGLTGAVLFPLLPITYDGSQARFNYEIGMNDAVGMVIGEVGLFTQSGVLVARTVLASPITKTNSFGFNGYYPIKIL